MKKTGFQYTGSDNLEVMAEAANYNAFLATLVTREIQCPIKAGNQRILDFGAGSGTYSDMLKDNNIQIDCIEPDSNLASILRNKKYKVYEGVSDIKSASYDLIFSFNVFEHIEADQAEFRNLTKLLKSGGKLIIYVPAFNILFSSMDKKVGHFRRYRLKNLRELNKSDELTIKRIGYIDPVGFFAALVFRLFGNKNGDISTKNIIFYDRFIFPTSNKVSFVTKKIFGKNALVVFEKNTTK